MASTVVQLVARLRRGWPNSPILGKEMRVTSRRGWLYGLRLAYVAMLGVFTTVVWAATTQGFTGGVQAFRAADAGKHIVNSILWFQFLVAQGITIVLLSASISGEIRKRTLPLLLTTPLGFFQIVWEKVVGGLSYVMILLLCCLPLLSIVRVFGGVPWGFVLTSLGVTVTACLFAGAVATYFSTLVGSSISAALLGLVAVAGFNLAGWMPVPVILIVLDICLCWGMFRRQEEGKPRPGSGPVSFRRVFGAMILLAILAVLCGYSYSRKLVLVLSPGFALYTSSKNMMIPGKQVAPEIMLAVHCLVMAAVSLAVLRRASARLQQIARSRIWGLEALAAPPVVDPAVAARALSEIGNPQIPPVAAAVIGRLAGEAAAVVAPPAWPTRAPDSLADAEASWTPPLPTERLGSPLLWKDTRKMLFHSDSLRFFGQLLPLSVMIIVYAFSLMTAAFRSILWHSVILSIYMVAGTVMTAVFSATVLSAERQSRTLPILLTTGLSDSHILWAKGAAVFYRCLPAWGPLLIHTAVFTLCFQLDGLAMVGMVQLVIWVHLFLCGSGFLFSMVLRGTSLPLMANLATAGFLWLIVPGLAPLVGQALGPNIVHPAVVERLSALRTLTPLGQTVSIIQACPGRWSLDEPAYDAPYDQQGHASRRRGAAAVSAQEAVLEGAMSLAVYGAAGGVLLWLARRKFRQNAFA